MLLLYRGAGDVLQLMEVEGLQMLRLQTAQGDALFPEIGDDLLQHVGGIVAVGRHLHGALDDLQPVLHVVGKKHGAGQIAGAFAGSVIFPTQHVEHLLRLFLVALDRQPCVDPGLPSFARCGVPITQYNIVDAVLFL